MPPLSEARVCMYLKLSGLLYGKQGGTTGSLNSSLILGAGFFVFKFNFK